MASARLTLTSAKIGRLVLNRKPVTTGGMPVSKVSVTTEPSRNAGKSKSLSRLTGSDSA